MRCLLWVLAAAALTVLSAAGLGGKDLQPLYGFGSGPGPSGPPYKAPAADGPVVVLLDEGVEPLFPLLTNPVGGEPGTVAREDGDVFAGVEAVRVTPLQKYQSHVPGWQFKIVEAPKEAGEFRYVRVAWKKIGGSGIMVQFHDSVKQGWGLRYHAGQNTAGWESRAVAATAPASWEVVTRDLFKDFGPVTIAGLALTALDGEAALFDHILLGRTVADLDRATDAALGRVKPAKPLAGRERDGLWDDLLGPDRRKAATALRQFLATAPDQVEYLRSRLPKPDGATAARVKQLVAAFGSDDFDTRQSATDELVKIGPAALPAVHEAAKSSDPEVQYRAEQVLKRLGSDGPGYGPAGRILRVMERAATPSARDLLAQLAAGEFGSEYVADAKAVLARMAYK